MDETIIEEAPKMTRKTLDTLKKLSLRYNPDEDVLYLKDDGNIPAVSHDWNGEIWIRFEPVSRKIIGLEIEDFESVFVRKHPEVAKAWKTVKLSLNRKGTATDENDVCRSFITLLLSFFEE